MDSTLALVTEIPFGCLLIRITLTPSVDVKGGGAFWYVQVMVGCGIASTLQAMATFPPCITVTELLPDLVTIA